MKSFYKNAFIVAVICIIVGIGMVIVGAAKGGIELFRHMVENNEFNFSPQDLEEWRNDFTIEGDVDTGDIDIGDIEVGNGEGTETFDMSKENIENMELLLEASLVRIEYEDTDTFQVKIEKSKIGENSCEVKGNTLYLTSTKAKGKSLTGDAKPHKIILTIPKDYVFQEVKISLGAGDVQGEYLYADNIYASVGAGNMTFEKLSAKNKIETSVGAGNFEAEELEAVKADIRCEAGRTYMDDVAVQDDITLSCDAGYIYMDIQGKEKSYNYDLDCSIGSITVGRQTHGGLNFCKQTNHHADRTLKAECNVGAIELEFH